MKLDSSELQGFLKEVRSAQNLMKQVSLELKIEGALFKCFSVNFLLLMICAWNFIFHNFGMLDVRSSNAKGF